MTAGMFVLGAGVLFAQGCLVNTSSTTVYSGNRVSKTALAKLEKGESTEEFVLATIGAPSDKHELADGSVLWKYEWSRRQRSSGAVFLLLNADSTTERDSRAFIQMRDGVVEDYWIE